MARAVAVIPGQCVPPEPRPPRRDAKRDSNARIELKSHCDGAVPPAVAGATRRITSLARRAGPGRVLPRLRPMLFESHFKSYFGNVKAFNLKKFKIIAEPVAAMAGGGLRLGGDGRRIP